MSDQEQDSAHRPFHLEGDLVVFDPIPDPRMTAVETRENEAHEFQRELVKANKKVANFTIVLAFATFCTIGVGLWQGAISQKAANAAEKAVSVARDTLDETIRSNAAQEAANEQSLRANIENFQKDQRPWLALKFLSYTAKENKGVKSVELSITIANTGKSPAFDIVLDHSGYISSDGPINVDDWLKTNKLPNALPGTSTILASQESITVPLNPNLTAAQDAVVQKGELFLYIIGDIHYVDTFKVKHLTRFCGVYNPAFNHFDNCRFHHYADRN